MHALFVAFHKRNMRILEKAEKGKATQLGFESKIGSLEAKARGKKQERRRSHRRRAKHEISRNLKSCTSS